MNAMTLDQLKSENGDSQLYMLVRKEIASVREYGETTDPADFQVLANDRDDATFPDPIFYNGNENGPDENVDKLISLFDNETIEKITVEGQFYARYEQSDELEPTFSWWGVDITRN